MYVAWMLVNRSPIHWETKERIYLHVYIYIYKVINPRGQENSEKTDGKIISLEKVKRSKLVWDTQNKV